MAMLSNASITIYALASLSAIMLVWIVLLEFRLKKLFKGGRPGGLEKFLTQMNAEFKELDNSRKETEKYLMTVEKRLRNSVQNVRMMRFNPFNDSGSNQSFTIALLNEEGSGAVITGLHSREKINVYAKPIMNFQSEHKLTSEEEKIIKKTDN